MAQVIRRVLAEHRLHRGGIGIDVGDHDDDIPRPEAWILVEPGQQLVVEDFHFPLRTVGEMEADRLIVHRNGWPLLAGFGQGPQVQDIGLQLTEQVAGIRFVEQVDAPPTDRLELGLVAGAVIVAVEQVDIVAALLAPGREQWMRVLVQTVVIQLQRHAGAALLALILVPQQVLVTDDIAPVVLAGIEHAEQHLAEPADGGQRLQHLRRQGRDTEDDDPPRQARGPFIQLGEAPDEAGMDTGAAVCQPGRTDILQQRTPQCWLPAIGPLQQFDAVAGMANLIAPLGPVTQPVGAVNLILVKQVSQSLGQLIALAAILVVGQEALQGFEYGLVHHRWQQAHQPPGQRRLVQG